MYEGEGTYAFLKAAALVTLILTVIVAIVLLRESNNFWVGLLALVEGMVLSAVLWAIGTIGVHVVAIRSEVAPVTAVPIVPPRPPTTYSIVLRGMGGANADWIAKTVRGYADQRIDPGDVVAGAVLASGLTYAYAEPLREALTRRGADVEMREEA